MGDKRTSAVDIMVEYIPNQERRVGSVVIQLEWSENTTPIILPNNYTLWQITQ